jgi:hypothetical protein
MLSIMNNIDLKKIIHHLSESHAYNKNYNAFLKQIDEARTLGQRMCLFNVDMLDERDKHNFSEKLGIPIEVFNAFLTDNATWYRIVHDFKETLGPPDRVR